MDNSQQPAWTCSKSKFKKLTNTSVCFTWKLNAVSIHLIQRPVDHSSALFQGGQKLCLVYVHDFHDLMTDRWKEKTYLHAYSRHLTHVLSGKQYHRGSEWSTHTHLYLCIFSHTHPVSFCVQLGISVTLWSQRIRCFWILKSDWTQSVELSVPGTHQDVGHSGHQARQRTLWSLQHFRGEAHSSA